MMTKTRCVMEATGRHLSHDFIVFSLVEEDNAAPLRTLHIAGRDWYEMGQPTTITVTVEPGDKLN